MLSRPRTLESRAVAAIEAHGVLLVYPVQNRPEPRSLWHALHPRARMRWAWDDSADERVVELWHLRERLARSRKVVYAKWLGGRATFFSRAVFRAALATLKAERDLEAGLGRASRDLLDIVRDDSPQPTRRLRESAGLEGRGNETAFTRAMRPLWERMLIVGTGEVEEGGFPSLAVGATELIHEPLWLDAERLRPEDTAILAGVMARAPSFARVFRRVEKGLRPRNATAAD
jgi:hypothetical protein